MTPEERADAIKLWTHWNGTREDRTWDDVRSDVAAAIREAERAARLTEAETWQRMILASPNVRRAWEERRGERGSFSADDAASLLADALDETARERAAFERGARAMRAAIVAECYGAWDTINSREINFLPLPEYQP